MARNSSRAFRTRARQIIARDGGICHICGHDGADTVDHLIPHKLWPKDPTGQPLPGLDDPNNLAPAHGTRGTAQHNPCNTPPCNGRLCNQSRGAGDTTPPETHSRNW